MNKALRVLDTLSHILKAIERIDRYTAAMNEQGFLGNELVQDAVIRNVEIIGEASNNIQRMDPDFAAQHDDIPWLVMYTMRNRVSHGYDKVDLESSGRRFNVTFRACTRGYVPRTPAPRAMPDPPRHSDSFLQGPP